MFSPDFKILSTKVVFREQLNQKASEDEKARLVRFTEEKNNQILHYNNKLAKLQTRLDQVKSVKRNTFFTD